MHPLTPDELRVIRSRISMTLANLGECRIYWHAAERRIVARSIYVERHFRVPGGAVLVGNYRHGVEIADVLGDLREVMAALPEPEAAPVDSRELAEPETPAPASQAVTGDAHERRGRPSPRPHPWRAQRPL